MPRKPSIPQRTVRTVAPHLPGPIRRRFRRGWRAYQRRFDPEWYRHTMGRSESWEVLGRLQFEFLAGHGLQPSHYFLDVGCGPLRGGVHFVRYLEPGHYFGVDRRADRLRIGRDVELKVAGLTDKHPVLTQMDDFGFERLEQTFDYALAQSVFTHLPANKVLRCLMSMEKVLAPGGKFFATIYVNEQGKDYLNPIEQTPGILTRMDKDPFHYDLSIFEWICAGTSLTVEYLGDWESPRNQKMLLFTKA